MPIVGNLDMNKQSLLLLFLAFMTSIFGDVVDNGLKQLSLNDRMCMKWFFDEAITKDQAAHVIFFNNKPVCFTGPALKHRDKNFKDTLVLRGWHAFKKNENLFPHPNFIFNEYVKESGGDFIDLKPPKGCKINPVVFMGNPNSPQVKELISTYEKELEEISGTYKQKKDPLKMILEKLCDCN